MTLSFNIIKILEVLIKMTIKEFRLMEENRNLSLIDQGYEIMQIKYG